MADPYSGLSYKTVAELERLRREQDVPAQIPVSIPQAHDDWQLQELRKKISDEQAAYAERERQLNGPIPASPTLGERAQRTLADILWNKPKAYWGPMLRDLMK